MLFTPFMLEISSSSIWTIVILVAMIVLFYFLLIRPQKKQEKAANEMRNNLRVGDEVTTIGGIVGKVVSLRDETVVLETTKDKTHIRFLRAAIRTVDVRAEDSAAPDKKPAEPVAATKSGSKKGKKNDKIEPQLDKTAAGDAVEQPEEATAPAEEAPAADATEATDATEGENKNA
jgi:preprotein translocase subunit YajC